MPEGKEAPMDDVTKGMFAKAAAELAQSRAEIRKMKAELAAFDKKVEAIETVLQ